MGAAFSANRALQSVQLPDTSSSDSRYSGATFMAIFSRSKPDVVVNDGLVDAFSDGAAAANQIERGLTLKQALRTHKEAIAWSLFLSTAVIMEGFDVVLITGFFALDQFQEKFGSVVDPRKSGASVDMKGADIEPRYELSAMWKAAFTNGAFVGEIIGLCLCGYMAEKLGYKKTMVAALLFITMTIFLLFFAQNVGMILAGQILCGIPWGVFQTLPTTYAADICPVSLRPYLTTYVNFAWVVGMLLGSGVARGTMSLVGDWSWRLPLGLQWMWPLPLVIGVLCAPESPWWLVRHDRVEQARNTLLKLYSNQDPQYNPQLDGPSDVPNADDTLDLIITANAHEKQMTSGTSYLDCLRTAHGTLRRTEAACVIWSIQTACGSSLMYFSTLFYKHAGLPAEQAFSLTLGQYGLGCLGTIAAWFLMAASGRRTLYMAGLAVMGVLLCGMGLAGSVGASESAAGWAAGTLLLLYTLVYDMTIGPVCYALVADMPSARLRNQTVVMARLSYNVLAIAANTLTPYMLNTGEWNWGAKVGWFWAGGCAVGWVWCFYRLPEPKGRTVEEMDLLFEGGVPARKFACTKVGAGEG